jgi:hypothetical protein
MDLSGFHHPLRAAPRAGCSAEALHAVTAILIREAGVIAGVVFEDALRRICRKHRITEKDVNLDSLISALVKIGALTDMKAKRARVAAHVRTKATHAQCRRRSS